jgi:curli biogenesis system outer membrane secretion channel CsgG
MLTSVPAPALAQPRYEPAYPAYNGPRKTIAVTRFDAVGSFAAEYGGWDIGGGLAAMLVGELAKTNRFVVVERAELPALLREQQMASSGVTTGDDRPLLGAQILVRGSVTEFDQDEGGGGFNIGLARNNFLGGLGLAQMTGHVTIDLRMIDASTGAIISTHRVDKRVSESSVALRARTDDIAFGGDTFNKTSLGRASREAIEQAVAEIVMGMDNVPWQALVAGVDNDRVFINAGRNANIAPGMTLRAVRADRTITDPATGQVLGSERRTIGDLTVVQVEDRYAVARWMGVEPPRRGDTVQLLAGY